MKISFKPLLEFTLYNPSNIFSSLRLHLKTKTRESKEERGPWNPKNPTFFHCFFARILWNPIPRCFDLFGGVLSASPMGKNQAYKAMQRARVGSTSGGPEEIEDGMVCPLSYHNLFISSFLRINLCGFGAWPLKL